MIGPSHRRLSNWEKRCHRFDFGRLLGDVMVGEEGEGGLVLVIERDVIAACFLEAGVS